MDDRYLEPELEPYVTALGQFALAWNDLQYNLCELFSLACLDQPPRAGDTISYLPHYVWHAIKSDRSQRDMLEAAIKHSKLGAGSEFGKHGKWLVDKVGSLEERRNNILHSPLIVLHVGNDSRKIIANMYGRNPRAVKLNMAVDLLEEVRSARDNAIKLSDYAYLLAMALMGAPRTAWPDKPELQGQRQKEKTATQTPTSHK